MYGTLLFVLAFMLQRKWVTVPSQQIYSHTNTFIFSSTYHQRLYWADKRCSVTSIWYLKLHVCHSFATTSTCNTGQSACQKQMCQNVFLFLMWSSKILQSRAWNCLSSIVAWNFLQISAHHSDSIKGKSCIWMRTRWTCNWLSQHWHPLYCLRLCPHDLKNVCCKNVLTLEMSDPECLYSETFVWAWSEHRRLVASVAV